MDSMIPPAMTCTRRHSAQGVAYHHEIAPGLAGWGPASMLTQSSIASGDGTETVSIRCALNVDASATVTRWFIRARAALR